MALTDVTVKALKPLDCRYMRCDGSGLYVEVLPSGEKSWILRYRFRGRPARISLGRYPLMSLREARDERDEMRKLVRCGISPIEQRRQMRRDADSDLTVRRFGDRYFREQVESKWKNPASIRRYLDNEIFPTLGDRQLKDVSALDVQALVYRKRDHGQVAAAVQLRSVMKWITYSRNTRKNGSGCCSGGATTWTASRRRRTSSSETSLARATAQRSRGVIIRISDN